MNSQVQRYFRKQADEEMPLSLFHGVVALHESRDLTWENAQDKILHIPRGWYELCQLPVSDRIEFTRDFWLSTLPYHPKGFQQLQSFFSNLDDIGVFLTQLAFDSPYECEMVYSLKDDSGFFRGGLPCTASDVAYLRRRFDGILPEDYLAFVRIHDGFSKQRDTGVIPTKNLEIVHHQLQEGVGEKGMITCQEEAIDPAELIPFYESYGQGNYQCFYGNWRPEDGVGNLYYSSTQRTISDYHNKNDRKNNLAFPTFLDWLLHYLQD